MNSPTNQNLAFIWRCDAVNRGCIYKYTIFSGRMCGFVLFVTHSWCNSCLPACHSWFPFHLVSQATSLASAPRETETSASSPSVLQRFRRFFTGHQKSVVRSEIRRIRFRFFSLQGKGCCQDAQPPGRNQSLFLFFLFLVTNLVIELSQRLRSNSCSPASRLQCVTFRKIKPR